jgi:hypothetical protein
MTTRFGNSRNGRCAQLIGKLRQISFGKPPDIVNLIYVIKQRCAHQPYRPILLTPANRLLDSGSQSGQSLTLSGQSSP